MLYLSLYSLFVGFYWLVYLCWFNWGEINRAPIRWAECQPTVMVTFPLIKLELTSGIIYIPIDPGVRDCSYCRQLAWTTSTISRQLFRYKRIFQNQLETVATDYHLANESSLVAIVTVAAIDDLHWMDWQIVLPRDAHLTKHMTPSVLWEMMKRQWNFSWNHIFSEVTLIEDLHKNIISCHKQQVRS